ncbi:MAG TPA: amidase [Chitinophagaceae bacterium]|nr:amidase [Chitinophagaceae bacterium]
MLKFLPLLAALGVSVIIHAQTKSDTIRLIREAAGLYDLSFTQAEADSMTDGVEENLALYRALHQTYPPNDLAYPFAFHPAPAGYPVPRLQRPIAWDLAPVELPANREELAFYSIPQLASLIKSRKITSVELTRFFLDRLKKWGDTLQCVITLTEDLALHQAAQADKDLREGRYHGLLHGIPYGLKDLFAVRGYKTTWGTTPYKDQVIDEDAFVYQQLRKAGAVLCAKLSLGALAFNNKWFGGETKNPWNLKQGSSGSSAGSAAATAAGLLPFTLGTETLGSIVSPSDRCGTTGLRPSFGAISRSGAMVLCWSLDKIGPICRSAEDAAIVYYYIKGSDGKDPASADHAFNFAPHRDIRSLRIAYAANYFRDSRNREVARVIEVFRSLGARVQAVDFPDSTLYPVNLVGIILNAESAAAFDELTRTNRDDLIERQDKDFWPNSFRVARTIPAVEYINANRYRSTLCRKMAEFMKDYDVLIVPTFEGSQLSITNLTGNPVVCLPAGFRGDGTPFSVSFIGRLYDEASILEAAKAYQDATSYHKLHPALFRQ